MRLLELYIELSARGGTATKAYLDSVRDRAQKLEKALNTGAFKGFAQQHAAFARQMAQLQKEAMAQAGMKPTSALEEAFQARKEKVKELAAALASGEFEKFAFREAKLAKVETDLAAKMDAIRKVSTKKAGIEDPDEGMMKQMGIDPSIMANMGKARREMTRMNRAFRTLGGEMAQGMGTVGAMFQKAVSRQMEPQMKIIQRELVEATIKMRGWSGASATAFRGFIAGDTALGKFQYKLEEIQKHMEGLNKVATAVFVAGTASLTGMIAAASPAVFDTMTVSFQLLAQAMGEAFLPYAMQISVWLQQAANWVRGLTDEQKESYAKWILWTVGIAGAVFGVAKLVIVVKELIIAARSLGKELLILSVNPAFLAITALAGGMAYLYYQTYLANRAMQGSIDLLNQYENTLSRKDFQKTPIQQAIQGEPDPEKRKQMAKQELDDSLRAVFEARRKLGAFYEGKEQGGFLQFLGQMLPQNKFGDLVAGTLDPYGHGIRGGYQNARNEPKAQEEFVKANNRAFVAQKNYDEVVNGKKFAGSSAGADAADKLKLSFKGLPQPRYDDISSLGKQIQLAALNPGGDIQAELMKRQMEAITKTDKWQDEQTKLLQEIRDKKPTMKPTR